MPPVAFVADLPSTVTLGQGKAVSRIQLAKTGKFKDPRYGNFTITTTMFDKWQSNFATLVLGQDKLGIPIDPDHAPEKKGETEAYGWVTKLDRMGKDGKTPTPNELWGVVEWNDKGIDAIQNRRYAYISPSYAENYADETGKLHGTHIVGAALTNRPFLGMATVSLSAAPFAVEDGEPVVDSPSHMPELTAELLTSLGLSTETATTVLAAEDPFVALRATMAEAAKPEAPEPAKPDPVIAGGKTLSQLAQEQGMVIMSGAEVAKLAADAARGAAAADTLHKSTFSLAWDQAVTDGKVLPASKPAFELAYGADATATLTQLNDLPKGTIKVTLNGSGADPGDDPTTLSADTRSEIAQETAAGGRVSKPDVDRDRMSVRLDALLAEGKSDDEAFDIVEREFATVS